MSILRRLFHDARPRDALRPLYTAVVAEARRPGWYRDGHVPDTVDGRFDMVAAVLSLVLLRLEAEGEACRQPSALLTELFIADMDGQLREFGVGDVVVGKHVGKMMGALGGRLDAHRRARASGRYEEAVARNIFRAGDPVPTDVTRVAQGLAAFAERLVAVSADAILAGRLA